MKDYTVRTPCEVAGVWREQDEVFALTDTQAQHLAPPFGSVVVPVELQAAPDAVKTEKRARG